MNWRTVLLVAVALVLAAGYGITLAVIPEARPWGKTGARPSNRPVGAAGTERMIASGEYETGALTLEIPAARDVPTGGTRGGHCPKTRLGHILGVKLAQPHGLVIGTVIPDGPAAKAGIKQGDMLAAPSQCPRMVLPRFEAGEEPREMKVNVRRPRSSSEGETAETGPGGQKASSK